MTLSCPPSDPFPVPHEWYQPGGLIIGGIASQLIYVFYEVFFKEHPSQNLFQVPHMMTKCYQHILALAFAVKEINENAKILPNITLGFHIHDSYHDARMTYRSTIDLLFKSHRFVPNYKCDTQKNLIAIIGGISYDTSFHMRDIIGLYKIPQLAYGSFYTEEVRDTSRIPSFYRMVPNDAQQYIGIIRLLKHFEWTWVGLFTMDDDSGQNFLQTMEPLLSQNGICSAFTQRIPHQIHLDNLDETHDIALNMYVLVTDNKVTTFIVYGESLTIIWLRAILFMQDPTIFDCIFPNPHVTVEPKELCTGEESLDSLPRALFEMELSGHSYSIYNAVYTVAHALHNTYSPRSKQRTTERSERLKLQDVQPWQLHRFLHEISFNNSAGETMFFTNKREMGGGFDIMNLVTFPNKSFLRAKVGWVDPYTFNRKEFTIHEDLIIWNKAFNQVWKLGIPLSQDMDDCIRCPANQYPNQKKNGCIQKRISFLSYDESFGISLASFALSFSLITTLVIGTFIKYSDTPIVKANNRDLTYTLLIALLLCFLSSFLFVGRPGKVTCLLRQPMFGIVFSLAVSCVLAKTVTVVIAFMASKPGSSMRKWVGKRLAYVIVLSCSLIQASICTVWLMTSPPFPQLDMHSVAEETIVQCNEGSVIMFYCVLGYMGLLAIASFIVAFAARKLPDSFNEAKFI
uniref:vomeronasal type-2 receptor 26-like n=1 Tax=Podarcis muralis TaxID=64176 RepID=UPI0010A0BAFE